MSRSALATVLFEAIYLTSFSATANVPWPKNPARNPGNTFLKSPMVISVDAGNKRTCAVKSDHTVWCWGYNLLGACGIGRDDQAILVPSQVVAFDHSPLTEVRQVNVGNAITCALKINGTVWCWGWNHGQIPFADANTKAFNKAWPVMRSKDPLSFLTDIKALAVGEHACGILRSGDVICWGTNSDGGLGVDDITNPTRNNPGLVIPINDRRIRDMVAIDADAHTCAVRKDGHVFCWGRNFEKEADWKDQTRRIFTPREMLEANSQPITNAVSVATSAFATCVLRSNGRIACWGHCDNIFGQPNELCFREPTTVMFGNAAEADDVDSLRAGTGHFCFRRRRAFWCFGTNNGGQLGDGTRNGSGSRNAVPVTFGTLAQVQEGWAIFPGADHACFIGVDGRLSCWGTNDQGQLGNGANQDTLFPSLVAFP